MEQSEQLKRAELAGARAYFAYLVAWHLFRGMPLTHPLVRPMLQAALDECIRIEDELSKLEQRRG